MLGILGTRLSHEAFLTALEVEDNGFLFSCLPDIFSLLSWLPAAAHVYSGRI